MQGQAQLRLAATGKIVGLDHAALLALAGALDHDPRATALLLPHLETGMLQGLRERTADGGLEDER